MKKILALLGVVTVLAMSGCSKDNGVTEDPIIPEITLSKNSFIVGKAGGSLSVNVTVTTPDGKWTPKVYSSGKDWCTLSRTVNSNTLTIKVASNKDEKKRETTIEIKSDSDPTLKKNIKIKQAGAADGIIVETTTFEVQSKKHTLSVPFFANVDFNVEIEEGKDWIEYVPRSADDDDDEPLKFNITNNPDTEPREVLVTVSSAEPKESVTLKIKQKGKDSVANADAIPNDEVVKIADMKANSSIYGGTSILKNAYDGDLNSWVGANGGKFPVEFTCKFNNADRVDYVEIYPGQGEGIWGEVDVYGKVEGGEKTLIGSYDFKFSKEKQRLYFTLIKPKEVVFVVRTAANSAGIQAAVHEIIFYRKGAKDFNELDIFTDLSCSELRDDVTEEMIEAIPNDFFRDLASYIYSGEYDPKYRAATYKPYPHPDVDAKKFRTSGYTLFDNITGMYFEAGEHVVFVDETYDVPISIDVIDYTVKDHGDNYILYKGLNKLNIKNKGLIYVRYHSESPSAKPIRINFPTALVNGYYDIIENPEADVAAMLDKASSELFDMRGARAIYTFRVKDYKQYCGNTARAFDIMQMADSIVYLEEEFQGHHKYQTGGHRNRMLYVASPDKAFMYASGYHTGYSIHEMHGGAAMNTMLNPSQLRWNAWGPYHEVGHKNQIPGFNWAGMGEVSNNILSMYCVMKFRGWGESDYVFHEGKEYIRDANGKVIRTHNDRYEAAWAELANYGENPHVYSLCSDPFYKLVPLWQLYLYNTKVMGREDFYPDLHHIMRTSDDIPEDHGARQINFVKVCCDVAKEDLTEFFEKWGFLVVCDQVIDDYGDKRLIVTEEMVKAVKDHAAQYPKPEKKNIWFISNFNMQKFIDGDGSDVEGFETPRLN
ncbi:MAG: M60 family metallopeptidase [Alistipes sp.]|nr:M60 family metallopeptidase [Alistipes sp.]